MIHGWVSLDITIYMDCWSLNMMRMFSPITDLFSLDRNSFTWWWWSRFNRYLVLSVKMLGNEMTVYCCVLCRSHLLRPTPFVLTLTKHERDHRDITSVKSVHTDLLLQTEHVSGCLCSLQVEFNSTSFTLCYIMHLLSRTNISLSLSPHIDAFAVPECFSCVFHCCKCDTCTCTFICFQNKRGFVQLQK